MSPHKLLILAARVGNFQGIAQALHLGMKFGEQALYEAAAHGQIEVVNTFLVRSQHPRVTVSDHVKAVARGYSESVSRYPHNGIELRKLLTTYWSVLHDLKEVATNLVVDDQVELLSFMEDKGLIDMDYIRTTAQEHNKGKVLRYFTPVEELEPWLLTMESMEEEVQRRSPEDRVRMRYEAMKYGYTEYDSYLRSCGALICEDMADLVFTREDEGLVREILQTHTREWIIDAIQRSGDLLLPRYTRLFVEYGFSDLEIEFDSEGQLEEMVENVEYIKKCVKCGEDWYDLDRVLFLHAVKYGREEGVNSISVGRSDIEQGVIYAARQGMKDMVVMLLEKLKRTIRQVEGDCLIFPTVKRNILQRADSGCVMTVDWDIRKLIEGGELFG